MVCSKAIKLESSEELLFNHSGFFEKRTLISLLKEGWDKCLENGDKVIVSEEYLPRNFPKNLPPEDFDYDIREKAISYGALKKMYMNKFDMEYSPEAEEERSNFEIELWEKEGERRGAWAMYSQTMSYVRAIDRERNFKEEEERVYRKEGREGVEKLKKKKEDEERNLGRFLEIC